MPTQTKLQLFFDELTEIKNKIKDIKNSYKDVLLQNLEYKNINEKMKELRVKKKQIETSVKQDFSSEFQKLDDMKIDIENVNNNLSDEALSMLTKGQVVIVKDQYGNDYEPLFGVKFKKS